MRSESFILEQVQNGGKEEEGHWDLREWPTT